MIRALAIICVRNEAIHLPRCLKYLIDSDIDVHVIDNGSTDESREIANDFLGRGVVGIDELPWRGSFSLSDQLAFKQKIIDACDYDWIIHTDADEWLCSPFENKSFLEGIEQAHRAGYTCINFHEIVFAPLPGEDFYQEDYASKMTTYYFFQPTYPRLNRAWKREAGLMNRHSGGHRLAGENLSVYPTDFFLRHYIVLSEHHAAAKYVGRTFSAEDLEKGWHGNRLAIAPHNLQVRRIPGLWALGDPGEVDFNLSKPLGLHFWQW
jgi:glycosyltransferase involved in cell wall biosynthesis